MILISFFGYDIKQVVCVNRQKGIFDIISRSLNFKVTKLDDFPLFQSSQDIFSSRPVTQNRLLTIVGLCSRNL